MFMFEFHEIIEQIKTKYDNKPILIVDVFGGSGLLAHWAKRYYPQADVIFNDFDHYMERCNDWENVELTRACLSQRFGNKYKHQQEIKKHEDVEFINNMIQQEENPDLITLSSWLCYSSDSVKKTKQELIDSKKYFRVPKLNITNPSDYFSDLIVINQNAEDVKTFTDIINKMNTRNLPVFYILDPPYLYNDKTGYDERFFTIYSSIGFIEWFLIDVDLMMFESEKARFDEILRKLSNMNLLKMPKLKLFKHEARSSANSVTREMLMLKLSD